ncbi:acyltransferase [Luedemannella helvata]|uniref:Acyltransferase n=1 Tax=Luedemannella helvata TaxID=349315 RepID=A0ABN2KHF3_9ACTN
MSTVAGPLPRAHLDRTDPPPGPAASALSRLPSLTGMRWAAALLVFGEHILEQYLAPHFAVSQTVESGSWRLLKFAGAWGVTFFFMLSGFVLAWSARRNDTKLAFVRRRLAKIYPNHLVTMLGAVALALAVGITVTPGQLLAHLTLTQVWLPDSHVLFALNGLSWSLCAELFFYLCFPFILPRLLRLSTRQLRIAVVALPAIVIAYQVAIMAVEHGGLRSWLTYFWPPPRLLEFVLGMVLALLVKRGQWRGPGLRTAMTALCAAMLVGMFLPDPLGRAPAVIVPVMLLLPAAALADVSGARTLWSRRWMVYLGELSFAFYMVHLLVIRAFHEFGMLPERVDVIAAVAGTAALFALSFAAAVALYHGVERPMMRVLSPRRAARPAPPAAAGDGGTTPTPRP